jgi:2'-5' RNA ligase
MEISKNYLKKPKRDPHLHSPDHVLADELSSKLGDPRHFGYYLKTARTMDHNVLRHIMGGILEGNSSSPGALFAYLVKKHNQERDTASGWSVWLLPEEPADKQLSDIIKSFAQTFDSPLFKPHITLLSGLSLDSAKDLSTLQSQPTVSAQIKVPATADQFFKSIFLPVIKNKELLAIRRHCKKLLEVESKGTFTPHISLYYGNTQDNQKQPAIKEIVKTFPTSITFNRVALVKTTGKVPEWTINQVITLSQSHDT